MNLWLERINPQPIEPFSPTRDEFNRAWDWIFERDANGEFERAGLCLIIMRQKSLELHRQGVKQSAEMAVVGVWKRYSAPTAIPPRKVPTRTSQIPRRVTDVATA